MIADHTATAEALLQTAGIRGAPGASRGMMLDPRHATMLNQLAATSDRRFDWLYAQQQLMAHQEAVALYAAYAQSGRDPSLRRFAQEVLPSLELHLAHARRMARRI